jgi:hypothetical protein
MLKIVFKLSVVLLFLMPIVLDAQAPNTSISKGVKYKANIDAPLTSVELEKIKEIYQEATKEQVLERPMHLKRIKHLLRNRIRIIKIDIAEKQRSCPLLSEIELFDHYNKNLKRDLVFNKETFNPLKYNFEFFASVPKIYRVDGTNYYIQIKSQFQD